MQRCAIETVSASQRGLRLENSSVSVGRSARFTTQRKVQEGIPSMNNKKVISLAALLAITAFAMVPTAAQALEGSEGNKSPVHWQLNGKATAKGTNIPVIAWGTAKLKSAAGTILCKNAAASNNVNTAGGQARSEVVMFATYECKASGGECNPPAEERATATNLTGDASPNTGVWPSNTVEEGPANAEEKFRGLDLSGGGAGEHPIEVNIECFAAGENVGSLAFKSGAVLTETGSSTPLVLNGTSAAKPSETSFEDPGKETGHLYAATEAELVKETAGELIATTLGSPKIKDAGGTWNAKIKTGCRVLSKALFPNELVKEVNSTTEITLENKKNPTKNFGLETNPGVGAEFRCGALTVVPLQGTTEGKFKFVGYLDNATTPLVTIADSLSP